MAALGAVFYTHRANSRGTCLKLSLFYFCVIMSSFVFMFAGIVGGTVVIFPEEPYQTDLATLKHLFF